MTVEAELLATHPSPLRVAAFRRFVLANLVSATGSAMAPLALAYAVIGQGGGAGALGVVLATNTLPTIAFLLVGGVLADRFSRSRILFLGNLLAAVAQGVLAGIVGTGHATTVSIAACGLLSGVATAFTAPAAQGVVNQIVAPEQRQQANALVRLPGNAVKVLGPVIGGLIVAVSGPAWALGWDALTFVVAAVLLIGLRLEAPVAVGSAVADLRTGWSGFWSRRWLWTYTAAGTVVVAAWLAGYQLLGPVVAAEHYAGARSWGQIQGAFALGLVAGTLVCLRWKPHHLLAVAVVTGAGLVLPLGAMGLGLPLRYVLIAAVLAGVGLDVSVVCWTTAFQSYVPSEELGRMGAFNGIGERLAIPFGYLLTALAAGVWPGTVVLLVCAGAIALTTVLNLCVRDVYRIKRQPVREESRTGRVPVP
ncbi:MFS transporter [Streptomyces sp. NBC_01766]|uniref:MFS transporter n=1 Tax=Streptomyces sp. NBC_01766 TaxID=2975936 RepID=UPI002DD83536|nr:MFS transporter [Streptomyces sp. NBC_01766]WSC21396.1 MFS transporter [Streptomyces sp. NBC_01766]